MEQVPLFTRKACFPEEVLERVLSFVTLHKDRNAVSLVCKAWYHLEAHTRQHAFIGNCYAVSPVSLTQRFKNLKSLTVKGRPKFASFQLEPNWGGSADPWVSALVAAYPLFEELRLKRMSVSDECLSKLANSFPNFRALVLVTCRGFTTSGLAHIAANCRHLQVLETKECYVEHRGEWLNSFPESFTSLVSLNFSSCLETVDFNVLESLVARCTSLKSLRVNDVVTYRQLERLVAKAPQIVDLGTGAFGALNRSLAKRFEKAIAKCTELRSLSGFWVVNERSIPSLYPVCGNLSFLDLSYAMLIQSPEMIKIIRKCNRLQRLWVSDSLKDKGLQVVASTCKELRELRVFATCGPGLASEKGLISVSEGCPNLVSLLYFCRRMTNEALQTLARNNAQLISLHICIIVPWSPDYITKEPLDEGFGAVVKACKGLRRFTPSGFLTDKAFGYIGMYARQLETLSLVCAGQSNRGMQKILEGCPKLRKLEIRDSPFGDGALLCNVQKYKSLQSLWLSSCLVTVKGAISLAKAMPSLNVEVIKDEKIEDGKARKLYVYCSLAGQRADAPCSVFTCK